jgi:hypothetical protein
LLWISKLWSLFVRVLKNQGSHTEAVKSRYELLLVPAKMVLSGRRKIVKLAVGSKFASFLKQAYQRLEQWLNRTAPQLNLTIATPLQGFYLTQPKPPRKPPHNPITLIIRCPTADSRLMRNAVYPP